MEILPGCSRLHRNAIEGLLMDASRLYCWCVIAKEVPHRFFFFSYGQPTGGVNPYSQHIYGANLSTQRLGIWSDDLWPPNFETNRARTGNSEKIPLECVTRIDWKAAPAKKKESLWPWCYQQHVGIQKKFVKVPGGVRRMLWLTQDSFSSIFLECGGPEWLARRRRSVIK